MTRGLMVSMLMCSLAVSAGGQDCNPADRPASNRPAPDPEAEAHHGWIIGGGITDGSMRFVGAEEKAVAVGPVTSFVESGTRLVPSRPLQVIDASATPPPDTVHVVRFPSSATGMAGNLHLGYAFSPRLAVLLAGDFMEAEDSEFATAVYSAVVRYRPLGRVWLEAGPATGEISYSFQHGASEADSITGEGLLAAGGVSLLARPKWTLDVQARYAHIWYEGFQARNLSFGLSVGRVRSGKVPKPKAPVAAPLNGASGG
jgi:hypothetical protein